MIYTETHEWIDDAGRVGISTFAQNELGEIVYVQLPEVGQHIEKGEELAVLESTKAAADIYSPISGVVTAINTSLQSDITPLNKDPENTGYLCVIEQNKD